MRGMACRIVSAAIACIALSIAPDAQAYRLIQNTATIRTSSGFRVRCDDPAGFVHWSRSAVAMRLNPANQGGESGVVAALQNSLSAWTDVTPATYTFSYGGTTSAGFATDGTNTVLWASGNGCTGGCLAITALVLGPGQVITEADVSFNNDVDWTTNGGGYDVQAIAAHELGHCLGIHHTEITKPRNRPTMYASYFGTDGRTLESDDRDALNCSFTRYPPTGAAQEVASVSSSHGAGPGGVLLASQMHAGHPTLRFDMKEAGPVRLEVFDVAGRRMATLVNGLRDAGEHEIAWDGETPNGDARRGIYFARIETPEGRNGTTIYVGH
jgi:Matrixin/FlgD Ig-like domain